MLTSVLPQNITMQFIILSYRTEVYKLRVTAPRGIASVDQGSRSAEEEIKIEYNMIIIRFIMLR